MAREQYVAWLKSNGANEDEIKALTEGPGAAHAIKAFDTAAARAAELEQKTQEALAERDKTRSWYNDTALPFVESKQNELTAVKAEAARAKAALLDLQARGLSDVAKDMGYVPDDKGGGEGKPAAGAPTMDPKNYFTRDEVAQIADREGDAIAAAQDIAAEHSILFPGVPLRMRELRQLAIQKRISVEQAWMDKFGVPAARTAQEQKLKQADEDRIRKDERAKVEAEVATKTFMPGAGVYQSSRAPWAAPSGRGDKSPQPWDDQGGSDTARQSRRAERALQAMAKASEQRPS